MPPCLRPGAAARRSNPTSEVRGSSPEELPVSEVRDGGQEELPQAPTAEDKGGSREELPHVQGAMAAGAQEGLEELSHIEGQEGRR